MKYKKFDPSVPRKMYWSFEIENYSVCPECNSSMETKYRSYIIRTMKNNVDTESTIGGEIAYFCPKCPTIVLDYKKFGEFGNTFESGTMDYYMIVVGIINMNAIPKNKKHLPLGDDKNPIPLVPFSNKIKTVHFQRNLATETLNASIIDIDTINARIIDIIQNTPTIQQKNLKIGRNELCPCGSGKKYKKCCLDILKRK